MFDNIAAISSGLVNQPIGVIRISGSESFEIASKIFSGKVGSDKTITYGFIVDGNKKIDEVLVSWFKGPNTFTGEDIVEINAHGGVVVTNKILKLILSNGARMAEPGEFSRRSFLNGKMDLIKAESIHDLIFAKTEEQAQISVKKFDGETSGLIEELKDKILNIIATCETNIDYPEYEDIEDLTNKKLLPKLFDVQKNLNDILESSNSSRYIYNGISVAIVGKPNAGKSSLLNALLGEDKSIVTNIPGTTRDVVEGSMQINQVLLNFKDTAGIHDSDDKIEKIGIDKSISQINKSDLIIHLVDSLIGEDENDKKIENISKNKSYIKVWNKKDLKKNNGLSVSALKGDVKELIDEIKNRYKKININNKKIITNTRQLALIEKSKKSINEAINSLENGIFPDTVIIDIQSAWNDLANILGKADQTDLLDQMFSQFCLGK